MIDLAEHPDALVWINGTRVLRPSRERDFRAVTLTDAIFHDDRLSFERINAIREESVEYLASSSWGTALINSGQVGVWHNTLPLRPFRPSRKAYAAVLKGTLEHWGALTALGARYYSGGGDRETFPGTLPGYGGLLAGFGVDVRGEGIAWRAIREICDESFVQRIQSDDSFWNAFVTKKNSQQGTPDLVRENLDEIRALCAKGSWERSQWEFVRTECGPGEVDALLQQASASADLGLIMGVFVHALEDLDRASELFRRYEAENADVHWAAERIAEHIARTDPAEAAGILFRCADRAARTGKSWYRRAAAAVARSREILGSEHADLWHSHLARFTAKHGRRKALLALLGHDDESVPVRVEMPDETE
jgi:hypothetical protein